MNTRHSESEAWKQTADSAMRRYAAGDDRAFAPLYNALSPRLRAFLVRRLRGDEARAEDLLQQTFLQMHAARARYVADAEVMPWAFAIARRVLIDWIRRDREVAVEPNREEFEGPPSARVRNAPDRVLESRELAQNFERALSEIPAPQRAAFELTRCEGLSVSEAASALQTTSTAIRLRVHRTYTVLRAVASSESGPHPQSSKACSSCHSLDGAASRRTGRSPSASSRLDKVVRAIPSSRAA